MLKMHEKSRKSADKAVAFFSSHIDENGYYPAVASDLSCYYKSPMMFIYSGCNELANRILDSIRLKFMTDSGDFELSPIIKSAKQNILNIGIIQMDG